MLLIKALIAFLIAFSITLIELITSKYPRTIGLFWRRSGALWAYPATFGVISSGFTVAYTPLVRAGLLRVNVGAGESDMPTFLVAVILGITTKALLHIRLFNVSSAGSEFPVGTETIVQLFEPWLLRTIAIDEFNAVTSFLAKRAGRFNDLAEVKKKIKENLLGTATLPDNERTAFGVDVDEAITVRAAMEIYLRAFGATSLNLLFPLKRRP